MIRDVGSAIPTDTLHVNGTFLTTGGRFWAMGSLSISLQRMAQAQPADPQLLYKKLFLMPISTTGPIQHHYSRVPNVSSQLRVIPRTLRLRGSAAFVSMSAARQACCFLKETGYASQ